MNKLKNWSKVVEKGLDEYMLEKATTRPAMQAEIECDCLVAWNASTYGRDRRDTVHPMFMLAFVLGYRAAEGAGQ